jgi:hypothetical protein
LLKNQYLDQPKFLGLQQQSFVFHCVQDSAFLQWNVKNTLNVSNLYFYFCKKMHSLVSLPAVLLILGRLMELYLAIPPLPSTMQIFSFISPEWDHNKRRAFRWMNEMTASAQYMKRDLLSHTKDLIIAVAFKGARYWLKRFHRISNYK